MRVGVMFGGTGSERDVSCASAAQVLPALRRRGHDAIAIDAVSGVVPTSNEPDHLSDTVNDSSPCPIEYSAAEKRKMISRILTAIEGLAAVFLAMHGGIAEDGHLPALFELAAVPFTGSTYLASAVCMDKDISKRLFRADNISTPDWLVGPVTADRA